MLRVVPGAGGKLHDAGTYLFGKVGSGKAGTAIVENPDDIATLDAALFRIGRMNPERLASLHLLVHAQRRRVQLAVQPGSRLVRNQMQRMARRLGRPKPFGRLQPSGVTGAVVISKSGDG